MCFLSVDSLRLELVPIERGTFVMGSANELFSESPAHTVVIGADFLIGRYPVTQGQWATVMGENPSTFQDSPLQPVDGVSWQAAVDFCKRLSGQCGRLVRLPSEAEWEYACRATTAGDFHFGPWGPFTDESSVPAEVRKALSDFAWFDLNSQKRTHIVGQKQPNMWGLHDMIGNVWEWCDDVWHSDYDNAPRDGSPRHDGAERQPRRCLRGGAWDMDAFRCRSSYRSYDHKEIATARFGLRIATDAEPGVPSDDWQRALTQSS